MSTHRGPIHFARECYAVDLQPGAPVIVHAERSGRKIRVTPARTGSESLSELSGSGILIVGCLPSRVSITRWITAPFASIKKSRRVFATLLDIQLPFPMEECVCTFLDPSVGPDKQTQALAIAARKSDVQARLDEYSDAGVEPVVIDQEAMVLWTQSLRDVPPRQEQPEAVRAIVHLANAQSCLVIGVGEKFLSAHAMGVANAQQLSRLLRGRVTALLDESAPPAIEWIWCGVGAADPQILQSLQSQLEEQWQGTSTVVDEPQSFLARGIATRALLGGALLANFRTGPFAPAALLLRSRRRFAAAAWLLLLTGGLLCAANVATRVKLHQMDAASRHEVAKTVDRVAGYHVTAKGTQALQMAEAETGRRIRKLAPFSKVFESTESDALMRVLEIGQRENYHYDVISITPDGVQVSGVGPDWNSAQVLLKSLLELGYTLQLQRQDALPDGSIPFTIASGGGA